MAKTSAEDHRDGGPFGLQVFQSCCLLPILTFRFDKNGLPLIMQLYRLRMLLEGYLGPGCGFVAVAGGGARQTEGTLHQGTVSRSHTLWLLRIFHFLGCSTYRKYESLRCIVLQAFPVSLRSLLRLWQPATSTSSCQGHRQFSVYAVQVQINQFRTF